MSRGLPGLEVTGLAASPTAPSHLPRRDAIVTARTCALSLDRSASHAAASHRTPIIFDTCSRGRSAAGPATNSLYRFAALTTAPFIEPVTSEHGGTLPVST